MTFPILPNHSHATNQANPALVTFLALARVTVPTLPGHATLLALSGPLDSPNLACPVLATRHTQPGLTTRLTQPGRLTHQSRSDQTA